MMETDAQKLARLKEQYRIEKILQNFIHRYPEDMVKQRLLKNLLKRIRQKESK